MTIKKLLNKNKIKPKKYNPKLPISIENRYNTFLKEMMRYVYKIVNQESKPIKSLFFEQKKKENTVVKQDINIPKEIIKIFNKLKRKYRKRYTDKRLRYMAESIFNQTNEFNRLEQARMLNSLTSTAITQKLIANEIILSNTSSALTATKQVFIEKNVKLIRTVPDRFFNSLEQDVLRITEKQGRAKELSEQLTKRYKTSKTNAKRIARDQISKLNGNLAKQRQEEAGVDKYIWRTSEDERVRSSHASKNGKTYKWSNPPSDTGHPGEDYQCRCIAEGILD